MRVTLLISGIFNLLASVFCIYLNSVNVWNVGMLIGLFLAVTGIVYIVYSKSSIEEIYAKRGAILTLAILQLPVNIISSIILLVDYDTIKRDYRKYMESKDIVVTDNNVKQEKKEISKDIKRLDIILKIGVAMVIIAGIMIATTTWNEMSDVVKAIGIVVIGIVFFALSKFSEAKLKIQSTTVAYWLLSMVSFILGFFVLGYSGVINEWFSVNGDGLLVFYSVLSLFTAVLSYITYRKFNYKSIFYIMLTALAISIFCIIDFLADGKPKVSLLAISSLMLIINILPNAEKKEIKLIKNFSSILTYTIAIVILSEIDEVMVDFILVASLIVELISLVAVAITNKTDLTKVLSSISIIALTTVTLNKALANVEEVYQLVITRGVSVVLLIIACWVFTKDAKNRNVLLAIGLPIILSSVMYNVDIVIGIFVGCVSLAMIIWGAVNKEYKAVFIEGIIYTAVNIIIQLWEYWGEIPVWAYLLVGGLLLIGIVTFIELRKEKKKQ